MAVEPSSPSTRASTGARATSRGVATAAYESARATRPGLAGGGAAGRRRHRHPVPQHHRGHQPAGLPAAARPRRRRAHHRGRAPRQPAALGSGGDGGATSSAGRTAPSTSTTSSPASTRRPGRACWPSPAPPTSPDGCRRSTAIVERRPRARGPRRARRRPAGPPPAPPGRGRLRGLQRPQALRPLRRRRPGGPGATFADGDPFLAGGGAVDLVDLDEVWWTEPPEREEAGSPNVIGAVALEAALDDARPDRLGRPSRPTSRPWRARLRRGLAAIDGVRAPRPAPRHRHPGHRRLRGRGRPPRPGGGPAQRRVGHRRAPRLLLRPPLSHPPARAVPGRGRRLPGAGAGRRPPAMPGRGAGQLRDLDHRRPTSTPCWPPCRTWPPTPARAAAARSPTTRTSAPATTGP